MRSVIYYVPNLINYVRAICLIIMIYYIRKKPFHSFVAMFISGLLDVVDGKLARYTNETSKWGALMDFAFDKFTSKSFS
jgi:phosphatidylglycerophosphate synthase